MSLHAKLAVLSSCNAAPTSSASLKDGFARAFRMAGVPRVIVSLWSVDDRVSALLMKGFYESLSNGDAPPKALQKAKLGLIAAGYNDPFYWAPFILIGDPSPLTVAHFERSREGMDLFGYLLLGVAVIGGTIAYLSQMPGGARKSVRSLIGRDSS